MLLPLSVMAMTPVSDSTLSDVTGQAGVNINADLTMNIGIGTLAWGDSDGIGALTAYGWATGTAGGYVGVNNFNITNLRIKARETDTYNGYTTALLKPITIDVASKSTLYGGQTFVRFGTGSLQITMDAMSLQVALGDRVGGVVLDQILGTANLGGMEIYLSPFSYVDIYTAAGVGVNLTMNIIVDEFKMDYMSWGDTDGKNNVGIGVCMWMVDAAAGYIGLDNLAVGGPITITGTVRIDVNTSTIGIYAHGAPGTPISVVHIGFSDNFTVYVTGPITADVKLDGVAALNSANAKTLGDIYLSGFSLNIVNGSWVDIWAH
jgi:hypothetical protein